MRLFHVTNRKNLSSIKRDGLSRKYSRLWKGAGGVIYLANRVLMGDDDIVVEADVTGLEVTCVSEWEYICWDDIPVEKLTFMGSGKVCCSLCGKEHTAGFYQTVAIPCECPYCGGVACYFTVKETGDETK